MNGGMVFVRRTDGSYMWIPANYIWHLSKLPPSNADLWEQICFVHDFLIYERRRAEWQQRK